MSDIVGDLLGCVADVAVGGGKNGNDGCGAIIGVVLLIGIVVGVIAFFMVDDKPKNKPTKQTTEQKQSVNVKKVTQWDYVIANPQNVKSVHKAMGLWYIRYHRGEKVIHERITTRSTSFTDKKVSELQEAIALYKKNKPSMMDKAKSMFKKESKENVDNLN